MEEAGNGQIRSTSPSTSQDGSPLNSPSLKSKMHPIHNGGTELAPRGSKKTKAVPSINEGAEDRGLLDVPSSHFSYSVCPSTLSCKVQERIINRRNGRTNIHHHGITVRWTGFITDAFTTIINTPWYMILLVFMAAYILSWLLFGGLWLMAAKVSGMSNNETCLHDVTDFSSALLFSIETQVTIGFGNNYVSNDCIVGLLLLILQCLSGLMLDAFLLGLIFTKITRPRNRRKTILFGSRAVLCQHDDGTRYLEFRIGDIRKSQIAECHVRLVLYWYRRVGDDYVFEQHDLECGYENGTDRVVLLTPVIIRHRIDQSSPLWSVSPLTIHEEELEVVVVLEGVVEATGLTLQALWSYTVDKIVYGERLSSIVSRSGGRWVIHFDRFNEITELN